MSDECGNDEIIEALTNRRINVSETERARVRGVPILEYSSNSILDRIRDLDRIEQLEEIERLAKIE